MRRYFFYFVMISVFSFMLIALWGAKKDREKELVHELIHLQKTYQKTEDEYKLNQQIRDAEYNKIFNELIEVKTKNEQLHFTIEDKKIVEKTIVVSCYQEDVSWLSFFLPSVPFIVYTRDVEGGVNNIKNVGNEAYAYLTFIVNNYNSLPLNIAFVHGHVVAWHFSHNIGLVLQNLKWGKYGYLPLTDSEFLFKMPEPDRNIDEWEVVQRYWDKIFEQTLGPLPKALQAPCCGQFVVTKQRILAHSLNTYIFWLHFLESNELESYFSGRLFEYTWHMIFGEEAVWDPNHKFCEYTDGYCGKYYFSEFIPPMRTLEPKPKEENEHEDEHEQKK